LRICLGETRPLLLVASLRGVVMKMDPPDHPRIEESSYLLDATNPKQ
jgi:hypothetical protein